MAQVTVCFDLDGVLCNQTTGDYENAVPDREAIAVLNELKDRGVRIIIHTSRFMGRAKNDADEARRIGFDVTAKQLAGWGVRYDELHLGKPRYDLVIDDRSVMWTPDWPKIRGAVLEHLERKGPLNEAG